MLTKSAVRLWNQLFVSSKNKFTFWLPLCFGTAKGFVDARGSFLNSPDDNTDDMMEVNNAKIMLSAVEFTGVFTNVKYDCRHKDINKPEILIL